jgi:glycerol-3-phosphate dehydrogenase
MVALEAAGQGLRTVLLERDDFGGATSWNSLRIVHGGLRYLQTADLSRFYESVVERRWFLRHFPELVHPLPCLMPLYRENRRSPGVLRAGILINDLLSARRNAGVGTAGELPAGRWLSPSETRSRIPGVSLPELRGAALWYDARMALSQRIIIETLRWAAGLGGIALNYVEARELEVAGGGQLEGVIGIDRCNGARLAFRAPVVVNCAGPWSRVVAARFDRELEGLFRPSLAFNLVLDRAPLSDAAVAVNAGTGTYFLHEAGGRMFVGTHHEPRAGDSTRAEPSREEIARVLEKLNQAIPELGVQGKDVLEIRAGLMPVRRAGSIDLSTRPLIVDHGTVGGPAGLISVSGVKFTTARRVAEQVCTIILERRHRRYQPDVLTRSGGPVPVSAEETRSRIARDPGAFRTEVARIVAEEAVVHPEDLLLRRTEWGADSSIGPALAAVLGDFPDVRAH